MLAGNLQSVLEAYRTEITKSLEDAFNEAPALLGFNVSDFGSDALDKLKEYSLRPGKRIRGCLTSFAYDQASGQKFGEAGLRAACAVELVQSYLLIVDDVMDKSTLRRGLPTIHEIYAKQSPGQERHFSDMLAVNIGLVAQHLASTILAGVNAAPENVSQASLLFQRNILATTFGQLDDMNQHLGSSNVSEEDILRMYTLKSSYYTFINPLQIGLVLGGVDNKKILQEVEDFGIAAGIAFQLSDDILGVFGDSRVTGKSNLDDIKEGKFTVMVYYALQKSSPSEVKTLKSLLGNAEIDEQDLIKVQSILEDSGAKNYVKQAADKYANEAIANIRDSEFWGHEAKEFITALVEYSVKRER